MSLSVCIALNCFDSKSAALDAGEPELLAELMVCLIHLVLEGCVFRGYTGKDLACFNGWSFAWVRH
jgi:hypothetical protein